MIEECLGTYVYNGGKIHGAEVVAEGLTKIVSNCLDENYIQIINDFNGASEKIPKELLCLLSKLMYYPDI